ncbi:MULTISPECIES: baseplate J/gp47 family protein [unclassified Moraxella]|uniref:baseplate J/gp47 family protein n=1 Tax=unclassified Moraxella TaxID=2685852 RepID=UPI003AF52A42
MYPIPSFNQIRATILNEYLNQTGLAIPDDSDASIRADGTSAVVEGLYAHQSYIVRQLFVQTADEPYLYIHADQIGLPRLGGSIATGQIQAIATITGITIPVGSRLTDGKGYYWYTTNQAITTAGKAVTLQIQADKAGGSYNRDGSLLWVTGIAGVMPTVTIDTLSGGSDGEDLERWRNRLWEKKKLGKTLSRYEDLRQAVLGVAGVANAFIYPRRRGVGSVDVAITATGANGATLPSDSLLTQAQYALQNAAAFFEDVRAFKPTVIKLDVTAKVVGVNINNGEIYNIIERYLTGLAPAESYRESVLSALILGVTGVTDVVLTPNQNLDPTVSMEQVGWIRAGLIQVTQ